MKAEKNQPSCLKQCSTENLELLNTNSYFLAAFSFAWGSSSGKELTVAHLAWPAFLAKLKVAKKKQLAISECLKKKKHMCWKLSCTTTAKKGKRLPKKCGQPGFSEFTFSFEVQVSPARWKKVFLLQLDVEKKRKLKVILMNSFIHVVLIICFGNWPPQLLYFSRIARLPDNSTGWHGKRLRVCNPQNCGIVRKFWNLWKLTGYNLVFRDHRIHILWNSVTFWQITVLGPIAMNMWGTGRFADCVE